MSELRQLYDDYQKIYGLFGPFLTQTHPTYQRGALSYFPAASATAKHHLPAGCSRSTAESVAVLEVAEEVDWERFCKNCVKAQPGAPTWALDSLLEAIEPVLDTAERAGAVVDRDAGEIRAFVGLLDSADFPLPGPAHPRDWYEFWVALHGWLRYSYGVSRGLVNTEVETFRSRALEAFTRWCANLDVFASLMYARARFAMLGHQSFRRTGEISLAIPTSLGLSRWPSRLGLTLGRFVTYSASPEYVADVQLRDYSNIEAYKTALDERLLEVALTELGEKVDAELNAAWQGPQTLLSWNGLQRELPEDDLPLRGWFYPAVVVPSEDHSRVILGTIAQAHDSGGPEGLSLIWETAELARQTPRGNVAADWLRAAVTALR